MDDIDCLTQRFQELQHWISLERAAFAEAIKDRDPRRASRHQRAERALQRKLDKIQLQLYRARFIVSGWQV